MSGLTVTTMRRMRRLTLATAPLLAAAVLLAGSVTASVPATAAATAVVCDGQTDASPAIQADLDDDGVAVLPEGRCVIGTRLEASGPVSLTGAGQGLTTLVADANVDRILNVAGTVSAAVPLNNVGNSGPGEGAPFINLASGSFSPGDLIILTDDGDYQPNDPTYHNGEMLTVESTPNSGTVTLTAPVRGAWSDSKRRYLGQENARVYKVNPVRGVTLADLSLDMAPGVYRSMVRIEYADGVSIHDVTVNRGSGSAFELRSVHDAAVANVSISDLPDVGGYGVVLSGPTEDVTISGLRAERIRHAETTIGTPFGLPHDVTVTNGICSEASVACWDTHGAGENIVFDNLQALNSVSGFTIRSRRTTVQNSVVRGMSNGYGVYVAETTGQDVTIRDNEFYSIKVGNPIRVAAPIAGLRVVGNIIGPAATSTAVQYPSTATRVTISGNVIVQ